MDYEESVRLKVDVEHLTVKSTIPMELHWLYLHSLLYCFISIARFLRVELNGDHSCIMREAVF